MTEATAAIARGIGKPDLRYMQFSYDQVLQALTQEGFSPRKAAVYIEMFEAINTGLLAAQEPRSPGEQHTDFVRKVCAGCFCGRVSREGSHRLSQRLSGTGCDCLWTRISGSSL